MENQPLVTVYITNYNYQDYIEQSIESVLSQTLQDFELLIIDDGSTDQSKDIIERYRNRERITIIYQKNKGLNITNNVAMRTSKGKYIMRLDADDFLKSTALEQMSRILEQDESLGLVFPDYYYVDVDGHITGEERRHNFEKEVSLYDQPAHGACTMIRLSFLKKLGGYNESFTCQDGYDLWLKFITHYTVRNINEPLFYYRRHGKNLTTNEQRILQTRRAIKQNFLQKKLEKNSTLVVIPVRNIYINHQSWPLYKHGQKTILELKVEECLKASTTAVVYIISEDEEILDYSRALYAGNPEVKVLSRPGRLAGPNQTLGETVKLAVKDAQKEGTNFNFVMTATLDHPFTRADVMEECVNTLILFKTDAVITVRPDNKMYYRHTGHTLSPILDQEKFTRIEREALYKGAGGIMLSWRKSFEKHEKVNAGRISHVIVDEVTAFAVHSEFHFTLYRSLAGSLGEQQSIKEQS